MKKAVILLRDFSRLSIPDLLTRARAVYDGSIYSNSQKFSSPPVTQKDLQTLAGDLQEKYDAARTRDAIAIAKQDLADKLLLKALNDLSRYASPIVYNDKTAIEETGFQASGDETHPAQELGAPNFTIEVLPGGGLRLNMGQKGEADAFTVIVVEAAKGVNVQMTTDGLSIDGPALIRTDTHAKMTIMSLARHTHYTIYAFAANSAGASPLSAARDVSTQ